MLEAPIRDRAAERRASTRQEILDAAWDLAHEVGLTEVTLRALAHRVGMRAPSLYSYFALQERRVRRHVRAGVERLPGGDGRPGRVASAAAAELRCAGTRARSSTSPSPTWRATS